MQIAWLRSKDLKKTIARKLILVQFATSLVLVAGMYLFVQWSFDRGFIRYVEQREQQLIDGLVQELAAVHATDGGWEALALSSRRWFLLVMSAVGHPLRGHRLEDALKRIQANEWPPRTLPQTPSGLPQPLEWRIRLLDARHRVIYGRSDEPLSALKLHPINSGEEVVGYLGMREDDSVIFATRDLQFAAQQNQAYLLVALIMLLISAGVAMPLARYFVKPIRDLTSATHKLASGDYSPRVSHPTEDELGRLARDFNELAHTLSSNETLRRQWVADISHELRTPLTVLRGEIEAVRDGVYTLDGAAVESLNQEAVHLSRLVDDLYELSMSDIGALDYHKVPLDLAAIAADALEGTERMFEEKSIRVETQGLDDVKAFIHADPDRIAQLLFNLLQNTLRYTDAGGIARLTLGVDHGRALLVLEDSAPGVSEKDLPKLFDRLYRGSGSRSREAGGTGLGLAICRNIVDAHDGALSAETSTLGGLRITLELPLTAEESL